MKAFVGFLVLLFRIYCFPGLVITHFGFLFPKTGQLQASIRRRESVLVHFFYSTIIYLILAFFIFALVLGSIENSKISGEAPRRNEYVQVRPDFHEDVKAEMRSDIFAENPNQNRRSPDEIVDYNVANVTTVLEQSQDVAISNGPGDTANISPEKGIVDKPLRTGNPQILNHQNTTGDAIPNSLDSQACKIITNKIVENGIEKNQQIEICG